MQIKINGKIYDFSMGETILEVCRKNDIYIPTLCEHPDLKKEGLCRLCLVKTSNNPGLSISCRTEAEDLMEVKTEDEDIERARKINLQLLWVDHVGKCATCRRNGRCELQRLAREFQLDVSALVPDYAKFRKEEQLQLLKEKISRRVVDDGNDCIQRDSQYCINCRKCISACRDIQKIEEYGMNYRGIKTTVGTAGEKPMDCIFCGQCSIHCPTGAITEKDETEKLDQILQDKNKVKIFQVAPSVRFTLGEEFGLPPGGFVEKKIPTLLKRIGADYVFDTVFSADLTIMEEGTELINRLTRFLQGDSAVKLPMFTSCCPSWVLYVEKYWSKFIPHLSSAKSPQQMMGAVLKTHFANTKGIKRSDIVSVSVMPCTAKKFEAKREEMGRDGMQDVDLVITTRELGRYLRKRGFDISKVKNSNFDTSLGFSSGSGLIFGSTGGVMEAALRTAYEKLNCEELPKLEFEVVRGEAGIKVAEIDIPKGRCNAQAIKLKIAVAHEIRNAKKILEKLARGECDYHFVEVMACPSGCLGGGGQPVPCNAGIRKARRDAIYERDKDMPVRKSHENPEVLKLYEDFLGSPGGEISEKYLHTKYVDRSRR